MPDNAVTSIFAVLQQDSFHALFHGKILLIAADLLHIVVVDDEITDQV